MRARSALTGGVVLLLLAACTNDDGTTDATSPDDATTGVVTTLTPESTSSSALDLTAGATILAIPDQFGDAPADATAGAARTTDDTLIAIVTFGSSTCPQVPDPTATGSGGTVTVTFPATHEGTCSQDYVPATTVVALPDDTGSGELTVSIGDYGTVTLPAGSADAVWVTG